MKIAVYGSASGGLSDVEEKAKAIGREIAKQGHVLITGGCTGLPYAASFAAFEAGGKTIAFSPGTDLESHQKDHNFPVEGFSEYVFIPKDFGQNPLVCKKYRNVLSAAACDAAIIVSGRIGTMNEFTLAYDIGKNIGILEGSGGITNEAIKALLRDANKQSKSKIIWDSDPVQLVNRLIEL